jgi:preprotein translocase subunit YajC
MCVFVFFLIFLFFFSSNVYINYRTRQNQERSKTSSVTIGIKDGEEVNW